MIPPQLLVSNAGSLPTTRHMALSVAEELTHYFTPYWVGSRGSHLLNVPRLGRQVARRTLPPALMSRARSLLGPTEITRVALGRMGVVRFDYPLIWRRNVEFDASVSRLVEPESIVVSQYGASLATFQRVRRLGGRAVLDYPIARLDVGKALLSVEAAIHPDFADSISQPYALTPAPRELSRIAAEVDCADVVLVGSRYAAASFDGVVEPERMAVVPYGVDTAAFKPRNVERRPGPLRVLYAGQLSLRKGVVYMLESMRLLDRERFELTMVGPLLGRGDGLRRFEGLFRHLSDVRPQDMPGVYRDADVLVLPSLVEGSALVVLEAMASGIPVIVTPNVGADAVRDGVEGFIVPIRSPEAVAARLDELAKDEPLRTRMGAAAREAALKCHWDAFYEAVRLLILKPGMTEVSDRLISCIR